MLSKNIIVIALSKQSAQVSEVSVGRTPTKLQTNTYPLAGRKLEDVFAKLASTIKHNTVRILLSDNLSHTLHVTIPSKTSSRDEREAVAKKIKTEIPEILENDEWDYKEVKTKKDSKEVVVFAPVKRYFLELSAATTKANITIDAMEPTSIALERHEDPIIGLAMKKDTKGKDEKVLNIVPKTTLKQPVQKPVSQKQSVTQEQPVETEPRIQPKGSWFQKNPKKSLFIVAIVLSMSIGGITMTLRSRKEAPLKGQIEPTLAPAEPTEEPTETPKPVDISILTVQVLNGTGKAGASATVRSLIEDFGFASIETDNADLFTYTDTEVNTKKLVPDTIINQIEDELSDYTVEREKSLTEDAAYDVIIVVGEKN